MQNLLIGSVKAGDVLGKTILTDQGRVLVRNGMVLTDKIIARLKELGITMVIIDDDISENVNLEDDIIIFKIHIFGYIIVDYNHSNTKFLKASYYFIR